jgi:methylated-DNA-protein-cysteine methyltransferase-like protein
MPRAKRKITQALFLPLRKSTTQHRGEPEENPALLAIWEVIARVPRGRAATYGDVARAADLPGRARQVGYALRHAPDAMRLPWHRIVGAGGKISFPPQSRQYREQSRLLRSEGIEVLNGRVVRQALLALDEI